MIAVRLHAAARRELHQAIDWYAQEAGKRIATGFLEDFAQLQSLIREHPHIGSAAKSGVRTLVFKRYPYTLVYRVKETLAEIVAIAHHSRRPEYWTGRL